MLALSVILRAVLVLFVVRLGLRLAIDLFAPRPTAREASVDELVRDRVCRAFVPRSRAVRAVVGGHEELFCSSRCAQRALTEPAGNA